MNIRSMIDKHSRVCRFCLSDLDEDYDPTHIYRWIDKKIIVNNIDDVSDYWKTKDKPQELILCEQCGKLEITIIRESFVHENGLRFANTNYVGSTGTMDYGYSGTSSVNVVYFDGTAYTTTRQYRW